MLVNSWLQLFSRRTRKYQKDFLRSNVSREKKTCTSCEKFARNITRTHMCTCISVFVHVNTCTQQYAFRCMHKDASHEYAQKYTGTPRNTQPSIHIFINISIRIFIHVDVQIDTVKAKATISLRFQLCCKLQRMCFGALNYNTI